MAINAYTISKLARDAWVSPSLIRDYEWRGLVRPREVTRTGLRIYDRQALQRLRFVLEGKAAGIALDDLSALCQALDAGDREELDKCLFRVEQALGQRLKTLSAFRRQLASLGEAAAASETGA